MTSLSERDTRSPAAQAAGFPCSRGIDPAISVQDFRPEPPRAFARCSPTPSPEHRIVPKAGNHFWVRCSPYERGASRPSQTPPPMEGEFPLQTSPCRLHRILTRPLVGAAGSSLTDFGSYTSHSGVKDIAVPPIFGRRPWGATRKSAPPLAAVGGRFAIPDPSRLRCPILSSARERSMT